MESWNGWFLNTSVPVLTSQQAGFSENKLSGGWRLMAGAGLF
jgi:hypothetical protein